eukprot:1178761-Prymnesium_polylepis.1
MPVRVTPDARVKRSTAVATPAVSPRAGAALRERDIAGGPRAADAALAPPPGFAPSRLTRALRRRSQRLDARHRPAACSQSVTERRAHKALVSRGFTPTEYKRRLMA